MSRNKFKNEELIFLPLGGSDEIGMNLNLYHHQGKWLIIDCGAGFADDHTFPGVQLMSPKIDYLKDKLNDLEGVVLTHGHEDHLGTIALLYEELGCPTIYCTKFTAGIVNAKMGELGLLDICTVKTIDPAKKLKVGIFEMSFVNITHSIPEMNAVILHTEYGNVVHTGDWKFDPRPTIGDESDLAALKKIGEDGALAMVCDSTNIFKEKFGGSESDIEENLVNIFKKHDKRIVVTTFASNVGRVYTIAKAARQAGRKVALTGMSLNRITGIAKETGYLLDLDDFIPEKAIPNYSKNELVVIATGCQGEPRAQMAKIAEGRHENVSVSKGDVVVFSSKVIPGNDLSIFNMYNHLIRKGCMLYTEHTDFIHVSGHPSCEELKTMYELVRPKIAIPTHGEASHIYQHAKYAREDWNVPHALELANGTAVKLAPGKPEIKCVVESGYNAIDGSRLIDKDSEILKMRRRMRDDGIIFITLIYNDRNELAVQPSFSAPGVLDDHNDFEYIEELTGIVTDIANSYGGKANEKIFRAVRKEVRKTIKADTRKYPSIEIQIVRV